MFSISYSHDFFDQEKVKSFQNEFEKSGFIEVNTSGSTGKPTKIIHTKERVLASAQMTNHFFNLNEKTQALLCMSINTIAGKMMVARANEGNYRLHAEKPSTRPLKNLQSTIDFVAMVPVQLKESLESDLDKFKLVRTVLVGGGPIPKEVQQKLKENKLTVFHSFGMTETVSHIALRRVGIENDEYFSALSGVTFSTQDKQLVISAPHLSIENLITNDIIELHSEKEFRWIGRKDFVVNSGGYKIQLEELEKRLASYFSSPFFFWKEADEKWGEILVLCIEKDYSLDNLPGKLDFITHKWERPKKIYIIKDFIRSESGKVIREATFALKSISLEGYNK